MFKQLFVTASVKIGKDTTDTRCVNISEKQVIAVRKGGFQVVFEVGFVHEMSVARNFVFILKTFVLTLLPAGYKIPIGGIMEELGKVKLTKEQQAELTKEELQEYKFVRRKTLRQAIKYALCTASAGLIEFATFTIFMNVLPIDHAEQMTFITQVSTLTFVSTCISLALSILWNFTINRKFTFKSDGNVPRAMFLAFLFYVPFFPFKLWFNGFMPGYLVAGAAASAGITVAAYLAAHEIVTLAVEVCTMLLNAVLEFCWQKFVIYRKEEDSALQKYNVGEIGPNGEITPEKDAFNGLEMYELLHRGVDINALDDKKLRKILKDND